MVVLDVVKWIWSKFRKEEENENKKFDAVQWMWSEFRDQKEDEEKLAAVLQQGNRYEKGELLTLYVMKGDLRTVKVLVESGADIHHSVFWTAATYGREDVMDFLLEKGIDINSRHEALSEALLTNNWRTINLLLERGADISKVPKFFLKSVCKSGYTDVVKLMLEHCDFHCDDDNFHEADRENALFEAANGGHLDIVKLILDRGIVHVCADNDRALRRAASSGHVDVVKFLMSRGSNLPIARCCVKDNGLNVSIKHYSCAHWPEHKNIMVMFNVLSAFVSRERMFLFACANSHVDIISRLFLEDNNNNIIHTQHPVV